MDRTHIGQHPSSSYDDVNDNALLKWRQKATVLKSISYLSMNCNSVLWPSSELARNSLKCKMKLMNYFCAKKQKMKRRGLGIYWNEELDRE